MYHCSLLTCSLRVSITRAFGTNNAVLVFLINVTEITGIAIWRFKNTLLLSVKNTGENSAIKHEHVLKSNLFFITVTVSYLGISAKDFGVEADPVIRDKHFALI